MGPAGLFISELCRCAGDGKVVIYYLSNASVADWRWLVVWHEGVLAFKRAAE